MNTESYSDTDLDSGTTYYYKVTAYNAEGQSPPSNQTSETTLTELPDLDDMKPLN